MLTPIRTRPALALVLAVVTAACGCTVPGHAPQTAGRYCAIMDNSIGLYPGNSVTRMGVPIGRIERIDAATMSVRLTFTLDANITVPAHVTAITRTPTILADRSLELSGGDPAAGDLTPGACIPLQRTATPKSISESLGAITALVNQMTGAGGGDTVRRLVSAASSQLAGTGPAVADTLSNFAAAMNGLGIGAGDGQLLRDISSLTTTVTANWDTINSLLDHSVPVFDTLTASLSSLEHLLGPQLHPLLRALLDLSTHYRGIVWNTLDTATATVRLLAEHTGVIVRVAHILPNILDWIRRQWARLRGRTIPVISPRVAVNRDGNGQVCSRIEPDGKNHCGLYYGVPDDITSVDVLQLVLNRLKQP